MSGTFYSQVFAALHAINPILPVPEFPSVADICAKVAPLSEAIFRDWYELHRILDLHEVTIRKRWTKKNIRQRHAILQAAYPSIPPRHRPDFCALGQESLGKRRQGSRFRDIYLLPELNLEDLSKPRNFLLLLNSRGRNSPDVFSYNDLEKVELGRASEAIVPPYTSGCTMYLTGQKTAETYGRIVGWDDGPGVFEDLMFGIGMQPGEGLVALEAQQKMLRFLVKCAKLIIHDLPLDGKSIPEPPPLEDPAVDPELSSIAVYATGTSYRVPIQFDLHHLKRLAQAKIDQAQDHLWSLREDPGYFRDVALDYGEHRIENVPTAQGTKPPKLNTPSFWEHILGTIVVQAYCDVVIWSILKRQLDELEGLRKEFEADFAPDRILPKRYAKCMRHFQHFLNQCMKGSILDLRNVYGSPPLRKFFIRLPTQDPHTTEILLQLKPLSQSNSLPRIIPNIYQLFDDQRCLLLGRHNILDEIDRILRTEKKESDLITPWVLRHLIEMSVFSEFLRQIDFHQPRISFMFGLGDEDQFDWFNTIMDPATRISQSISFNSLGVASLGTPVPGRFVYPVHKKLTEVTVGQIRQAEAELDAFWAKVDGVVKQRTGQSPNEMLKDYIGQRKVERMPEWVKPELPVSPRSNLPAASPPGNNLTQFDLQKRTNGTLEKVDSIPTVSKEKVKTRGVGCLVTETGTEDTPVPQLSVSTSHIIVSRRVYQTFSRVFYTPSADRVPGEVPWTDFVHAMTRAGCSARRLMGSAWMFSIANLASVPREEDGSGRSIIIHEPHPAANIPFNHLRKHGRRLSRRWGWNIDTFSVE